MHTVAGVAGVERAVGVGQAGVEIDPLATVVKRILPQHPVEPVDPVGSVGHFGAPAVTRRRKHRTEEDPHPVRPRQFGHRADIVGDPLLVDRAVVARDVVRSGQNHDRPRPQRHHVALEPCQHLRRHLSADTACDETVRVEERGMSRVPPFGNRIPDEDDLRSYCERRIGSRIPSRIRPIPRLASG